MNRWSIVLHQGVLFAHLIAVALTLSAVLREDWRLLATRRIDAPRLARTARTVRCGLAVLWLTGLALVALGAASSAMPWSASPKLEAKLVVVVALTLNGWALHALVFARLASSVPIDARLALPAALGALSSASWVYAAFLGVARLVSPWLSFGGFLLLYGAVVGAALLAAAVFVRTGHGAPLQHRG